MAFAIALEAAEALPGGMPQLLLLVHMGCFLKVRRTSAVRAHHLQYVTWGPGGPAELILSSEAPRLSIRPGHSFALPPIYCVHADGRGELLLSATYFLILATVLVNGGTCAPLLERLGLLQGSHAGAAAGLPTK